MIEYQIKVIYKVFKYLPGYKELILRENVPRESAYSLEFVFKGNKPRDAAAQE